MSARQVFGTSTVYLAVTITEILASLVSIPILTRALSPADYGVMLFIANASALLSLLFGFALAQGLVVLVPAAGSEPARRDTATTILASIAIVSAVVCGVYALFAGQISTQFLGTPDRALVIRAGALSAFFVGLSLCLAWIIRLREQHWVYFFTQVPATLIQLGLILALVLVAKLGLISVYIAMAAATLFSATIYAWTSRQWLTGRFDRGILAKAATIGASMLPWQLATLLTTNTAGFFLVRSGHIGEAGLFAVAATMVAVPVNLSNSFNGAWTSFVLLRHAEPGIAATQRRVFELYSVTLLIAVSGLSLFAQEAFAVLIGAQFREGFHYVPPLAFAYCLYCFANTFSQGLQAKQRTAAFAWVGLAVAAVFLAVCLPLVPRLGATGIIIAMAAGFLTMLVSLQIASQRVMPVAYPWARHGLMWLIAACVVAPAYAIGIGWQAFAIKALALLAILGVPFLVGAAHVCDLRLALAILPKLRS